MANATGMIGGCSSWIQTKNSRENMMRINHRVGICSIFASTTSVSDPYKTLRIHPNASKSEIKKAFRKLALQYHPDVCRGNNNGVQFHHINEAYDMVMSQLREESAEQEMEMYNSYNEGLEEGVVGVDELDCELWKEWMGWEGAGTRDYSSHINPYI